MAVYIVDYKGVLPPSNIWKQLQILPDTQLPSAPVYGTIHWSSFLYSRRDLSNGTDIYRSGLGWEQFRCPSLPEGGLPPADTYPGNSTLANEASGIDTATGQPIIDAQAPRLAYTVNEALCPRGFFVAGATVVNSQIQRPYRFVRAASVQHSASTVLATELWGIQSLMEVDSLIDPGQGRVCQCRQASGERVHLGVSGSGISLAVADGGQVFVAVCAEPGAGERPEPRPADL